MWIDREESTPIRASLPLPPRASDGIPQVPPPLSVLTLAFARGEARLDRMPDPSAAAPLEWLRHYRDLFWLIQGTFGAADRGDEGPCQLLERGYYRLQVVATAPRVTPLVARRAVAIAQALEELLLLEGEERPDVILPVDRDDAGPDAPAFRRLEVRLIRSVLE